MTDFDFKQFYKRLETAATLTKREIFTLVALHALLSIPPSQRPPHAVDAAITAADKALGRLKEKN